MNKYGTPLLTEDNKENVKAKRFSLIQIGDTGSGKTTRALTASKFGKVLFLDFDGKATACARHIPEVFREHIIEENVLYNDVSTKGFDEVRDMVKDMQKDFESGQAPFSTLVIDTFTHLNDKAIYKVAGAKLERGGTPEIRDWGNIKSTLTGLFNSLFALPCNLILNAHFDVVDDQLGDQRLMIRGQGSFKNSLGGKFLDSQYLSIEGVENAYKVKLKNSRFLGINTTVDPKFVDPSGFATVPHLDIFGGQAFRAQAPKKEEEKKS